MPEMFSCLEKVNFSGMVGLINPKDPAFFPKLRNSKNVVSLKLVFTEGEESLPATKCLFTDFLFDNSNCLGKRFNVNLLVPVKGGSDKGLFGGRACGFLGF